MESKSLSALYLCGDDSNELPGFDTTDLDLDAPSSFSYNCIQNGSSSSDNPGASQPGSHSDRLNTGSMSQQSTTSYERSDSMSSQIGGSTGFNNSSKLDEHISNPDAVADDSGVSLDVNSRTDRQISSFLEPVVNYDSNSALAGCENLKPCVRQSSEEDYSIKTSVTKISGGAVKFSHNSVVGNGSEMDEIEDDIEDDEEDFEEDACGENGKRDGRGRRRRG